MRLRYEDSQRCASPVRYRWLYWLCWRLLAIAVALLAWRMVLLLLTHDLQRLVWGLLGKSPDLVDVGDLVFCVTSGALSSLAAGVAASLVRVGRGWLVMLMPGILIVAFSQEVIYAVPWDTIWVAANFVFVSLEFLGYLAGYLLGCRLSDEEMRLDEKRA